MVILVCPWSLRRARCNSPVAPRPLPLCANPALRGSTPLAAAGRPPLSNRYATDDRDVRVISSGTAAVIVARQLKDAPRRVVEPTNDEKGRAGTSPARPFSWFSGGAGNRTPVREEIDHSFYVRSPLIGCLHALASGRPTRG